MVDVYYTFNKIDSDLYIQKILQNFYNIRDPKLHKSINGKPFLPGDKVHFNLTHSKNITALAVGKSEVGFDCESLDGKARPAVLQRFTKSEQAEISSLADFYSHWTARESYIKYLGESLAAIWRKVEFRSGNIYFLGEKKDVKILQFRIENYIFSICGNYTKFNLHKIENF